MNRLISTAVNKRLSLKAVRYSLRWRLTSFLGLVLLVTLLVIGAGVVIFVHNTEVIAWRGRQGEAARNAGNSVGAFIRRAVDALSLVGLLGRDELTSKPQLLSQVLEQNLALQEVVYLDARGGVVASGSQDQPLLANLFTIPQSQWFLTAKQGQNYYGSLQTSATDEPYLIIALPAPENAVVAARLRMTVLWNVVSDIPFGESGQVYIVNREGQIIAHTDPQVVLAQTSLAKHTNLAQALQNSASEWYGEYQDLQGNPVVGVTAPVPGTDWVVVTELTQREAFATSRFAFLVLGGSLLLFGLLLTLVGGHYLDRTIFRPLEELRDGSERIGKGDLSYRIKIAHQDEVGQVAQAFNDMAARLHEQRLAVEQRNAQLEALYHLGLSLTSNLEVKTVLDLILDSTFKFLPELKDAHIFLYQERRLTFAASLWSDGRKDYMAAEPRPNGLTHTVAERGETVVIPDTRTHPLYANTAMTWSGALAGIPLKIGTRVVGVMTVAYESPLTIAEADLRLLRLLGDQAAIAIENAHLYEQTQQELIERQQTEADLQQTYSNLQRSNHLLAQILEVGNTLNRNLNLASLLQEIVQAVHDALGFSVVILNLVEDDRQYVRVGAHTGLDEAGGQLFTEAVYPWTEFANLLQERFQIEGCYFIPHNKFSWEHEFHGPVYTAVSDIDYDGLANSWHPDDALFVPIEIRPGQIEGIISVDQPVNGRRPDVETLRALQIFAQQAAAAIENAHLYEQVQQELAERKQAQEALHQLNAELENRVAERTDELADVNDNLLAEIMERQRVEVSLRQSELKYRLLIEQMPAVTYIARLDEIGSSVYVSPQVKSLLGYSAEEWMADTQLWFNLVHPDDRATIISESQVALAKGQAFRAEYRMFNREGQVVWIQDQTVVLPDEAGQSGLTQGVLVDITARKQAEEQLRMSLHEKEILLKEIHHRVKNNMQIISSLLNLQSSYISDAQALEIFQESQNRVRSMALIHEKLYSSKNLGKIDLGEYVSDLVNHLFRSYKADGKGITLNVQAEDVHLGIDAAVPCGLIINELISNALKHAFPLDSQGEILVELQKNQQQVSLRISDNGMGFPTDLDFQNTPSLGLQLVNTLVRQLDGTIELQNGSGTAFKISFSIQ